MAAVPPPSGKPTITFEKSKTEQNKGYLVVNGEYYEIELNPKESVLTEAIARSAYAVLESNILKPDFQSATITRDKVTITEKSDPAVPTAAPKAPRVIELTKPTVDAGVKEVAQRVTALFAQVTTKSIDVTKPKEPKKPADDKDAKAAAPKPPAPKRAPPKAPASPGAGTAPKDDKSASAVPKEDKTASKKPPEEPSPGSGAAAPSKSIELPNKVQYQLPTAGCTCHFASAVNFLVCLPQIREAMERSESVVPMTTADRADKSHIDEFRKKLLVVMDKQVKGEKVNEATYRELLEKASAFGFLKHTAYSQQQDAQEDVVHMLQTAADNNTISTQFIYQSVITSYVINADEAGMRKEEAARTKPDMVKLEANFKEAFYIDKTEAELRDAIAKGELLPGILMEGKGPKEPVLPFDVNSLSERPLPFGFTSSSLGDILGGLVGKKVAFKDVLEEFAKTKEGAARNVVIKTKDGKILRVSGVPKITPVLADGPENLVFTYKRYSFVDATARKFTDPIETPRELKIPGKFFKDGKERDYVLCSCIQHVPQRTILGTVSDDPRTGHYIAIQNIGGKFYHNDDRGTESARELTDVAAQDIINTGYVYGYVRKDVYERMVAKGTAAKLPTDAHLLD